MIIEELRSLMNLLKRQMDDVCSINKTAPPPNVGRIQGIIINYIITNSQQEIYQKDIEKLLTVRRSTATQILNGMEKNGLITRAEVKHDARLKKILLTEKAIELHDKVHKHFNEMEKLFETGLTTEDKKNFTRIITIIKSNIEKESKNV